MIIKQIFKNFYPVFALYHGLLIDKVCSIEGMPESFKSKIKAISQENILKKLEEVHYGSN